MWILTLLAGFHPTWPPSYIEEHVYAIEFNAEWGNRGFNNCNNRILFYDWCNVTIKKQDYEYVTREIHIIAARRVDQFHDQPVLGDKFYILRIQDDTVRRRITASHFKKTVTNGEDPEASDAAIFPRAQRRGLKYEH